MPKRRRKTRQPKKLFIDPLGQRQLVDKSMEQEIEEQESSPVECLGMTFESDEARREYFLEKLREKLKDPEFRKVEGFPIGEDEDILALSDPPYYTACPNPWLADFVQCYGKSYDPETDDYHREPFAADVSEGKNDPIYNVHTYHTKVPHKAIMRYILHYTEPGDVVFDGFCGTGMTGVAAQMCAATEAVQEAISGMPTREGQSASPLVGLRRSILGELAPAATFIAHGYACRFDDSGFQRTAQEVLRRVDDQCGWMFQTGHGGSSSMGTIDYTVWSDVFTCGDCGGSIVLWDAVINEETRRRVRARATPCPHCSAEQNLRTLKRQMEAYADWSTGAPVSRNKQVPIFVRYRLAKSSFEKRPDSCDLSTIARSEEVARSAPFWFPCVEMPDGLRKAKDAYALRGITHTHHFYTARGLVVFATLWQECSRQPLPVRHRLMFWAQSVALGFTRLNRYFESSYSQVNRYMKGALYVAPFTAEVSPRYALTGKVARLRCLDFARPGAAIVGTQSSSNLAIPSDCVDYIFTDPPFGRNLQYSELNFLWESWLRVRTASREEAIVDETIGKDNPFYHHVMAECFREFHRVLKPGRWMTVEFHNASNAIWSIIQQTITGAGFVVADVRVLDKQQITMQQWVGTNVVDRDLVISAYKPNGGLEQRFQLDAGTEAGAWDFVRTHLGQLPVFVLKDGRAEVVSERQNYLLFDRMVAFHVQRGVTVPLSAGEFYAGLAQRFPERDGMYFLPEQAAEYDRKRMTVKELLQLQLIVTDESSAIQWLRQQLQTKPQTFQELHPQFMREIGGWQKHETPLELSELLEQNFLRYDDTGEVPSQIHSYLSTNFKGLRKLSKDDPSLQGKAKDRWYVPDPNKAGDLERLRERALLREFEEYRTSSQRKLKVFRLEAVRAGFKRAWQQRDYGTIIAVAQKIPEAVLQEDPKLLMWYDQAVTRSEGDGGQSSGRD